MKLFGRKQVDEEEEEEKPARSSSRKKPVESLPKDPTRWLSILFLLLFLFISYLSWVSFS